MKMNLRVNQEVAILLRTCSAFRSQANLKLRVRVHFCQFEATAAATFSHRLTLCSVHRETVTHAASERGNT